MYRNDIDIFKCLIFEGGRSARAVTEQTSAISATAVQENWNRAVKMEKVINCLAPTEEPAADTQLSYTQMYVYAVANVVMLTEEENCCILFLFNIFIIVCLWHLSSTKLVMPYTSKYGTGNKIYKDLHTNFYVMSNGKQQISYYSQIDWNGLRCGHNRNSRAAYLATFRLKIISFLRCHFHSMIALANIFPNLFPFNVHKQATIHSHLLPCPCTLFFTLNTWTNNWNNWSSVNISTAYHVH